MIPKYEEIMLPFLKYLADGKEHGLSETHNFLAKQFKLTDEELRKLLPSGRQPNIGWLVAPHVPKAELEYFFKQCFGKNNCACLVN